MTLCSTQSRPGRASARTNPFRRNRNITPLAPERAQRQGAISALAFQLLGGRDAALDFLNTENKPLGGRPIAVATQSAARSEEHTSELQSLMRISYAFFCLINNNFINFFSNLFIFYYCLNFSTF